MQKARHWPESGTDHAAERMTRGPGSLDRRIPERGIFRARIKFGLYWDYYADCWIGSHGGVIP